MAEEVERKSKTTNSTPDKKCPAENITNPGRPAPLPFFFVFEEKGLRGLHPAGSLRFGAVFLVGENPLLKSCDR